MSSSNSGNGPPESNFDAMAETVAPDPMTERAQRRVGTKLRNKWHLDAVLGIGGMATVYAATHRNGGRAAVKMLHPELCVHPDVLRRFLHEGIAANSVDHEGCVRVIDDDVAEDGAPYLVTELLKGETLEDRRQRLGGRLAQDEVFAVAEQLLSVLAAAHDKGVIHRDLKPDNIFLTQSGQVKVLDFGIARFAQMSAATGGTRTGSLMGTPSFMPPEQARGLWDQVDGQSDVWAAGATLFAVLTGRAVHEGRSPNEIFLGAMTSTAPPVASLAPGVSLALAEVVDRALAFDKAYRWPSARAMQEALRRAYKICHSTSMPAAPIVVGEAAAGAATLASAMSTARPTAGSIPAVPVQSVPPATERRAAPWIAAAAVGAAALAILGGVAVVAPRWSGPRGTPAAATAPASLGITADSPALPPSASAGSTAPAPIDGTAAHPLDGAASTTNAPSAAQPVPIMSLPVASDRGRPVMHAKPKGPAAPVMAAPPTHAAPAAGDRCTPPYVIDPVTGKKKWRAECL
jgi:eukaryotic-like serine/threonine-protein kinase